MSLPTYNEIPETFRSHPTVILGNSPSINLVDLNKFEGLFTIGVNRILKAYVPHALLFCDDKIAREEKDDICRYTGIKLVYEPLIAKHPWISCLENVYTWKIHSAIRPSIPDLKICESMAADGCVQGEGSTPAYALQIAHSLGANPLALLGVDYSAPPLKVINGNEAKTHFYGEGTLVGSTGGGKFEGRHETWFTGIREQLNSRGVSTINLSPDDSAPFHKAGWTRMTVDEFISSI